MSRNIVQKGSSERRDQHRARGQQADTGCRNECLKMTHIRSSDGQDSHTELKQGVTECTNGRVLL